MTVRCQWCGEPMRPPYQHIRVCPDLNPAETALLIINQRDWLDVEAERVAHAYLDLLRDIAGRVT